MRSLTKPKSDQIIILSVLKIDFKSYKPTSLILIKKKQTQVANLLLGLWVHRKVVTTSTYVSIRIIFLRDIHPLVASLTCPDQARDWACNLGAYPWPEWNPGSFCLWVDALTIEQLARAGQLCIWMWKVLLLFLRSEICLFLQARVCFDAHTKLS